MGLLSVRSGILKRPAKLPRRGWTGRLITGIDLPIRGCRGGGRKGIRSTDPRWGIDVEDGLGGSERMSSNQWNSEKPPRLLTLQRYVRDK